MIFARGNAASDGMLSAGLRKLRTTNNESAAIGLVKRSIMPAGRNIIPKTNTGFIKTDRTPTITDINSKRKY